MRIGIVWTAFPRLTDTTVRFERYLQGFQALGHDAVIVSTAEAGVGFPWAGVTVPSLDDLRSPDLWARLRLDAALVVTWLGMSDLLVAMRPYVRHLISLADSDGCTGARVFPRQLLSRMWAMQTRLAPRLRSAGWWLRQYLWAYAPIDRQVLESSRLADRIIVYSPGAKQNLQAFFDFHRNSLLGQRVVVSPYPVDEAFDREPVSPDRLDQIVTIGRWGDPQKDAPLLSAAIWHYLRAGGRSRFILLGADGREWFAPLEAAYPAQVEYRGVVGQSDVRNLLGQSRVLLSTSRWESGPIVASEALLRGCSLVGPASIPSFRHFCDGGDFGITFSERSGRAVAEALAGEDQAWARGMRNPLAIADAWKGKFSAETICGQLLAGLDSAATPAAEPFERVAT